MILDPTSIELIMVRSSLRSRSLGFDLIHLGIITISAVEIGQLPPPFRVSVFTVHNTLDDARVSVEGVFLGTLLHVLVMLSVLVAIAHMPTLVPAVPWRAFRPDRVRSCAPSFIVPHLFVRQPVST